MYRTLLLCGLLIVGCVPEAKPVKFEQQEGVVTQRVARDTVIIAHGKKEERLPIEKVSIKDLVLEGKNVVIWVHPKNFDALSADICSYEEQVKKKGGSILLGHTPGVVEKSIRVDYKD